MKSLLCEVLLESLKISGLVFLMLVAVDLINVVAKGRIREGIKGGVWRQYLIASFLGITPGCLGAFASVSLYVHGNLTLGALVAGMVATAGDEEFVMLSLFPWQAALLFAFLFVCGVLCGWATDRIAVRLNIRPRESCSLETYHPEEESRGHYLREHVWGHILREHVWRVFLWTSGALLVVHLGLHSWDLTGFVREHTVWMLLLSGLVGIIPESGPHLIFVMLYAAGLVPFSVLFTSSFVQDGHGLLPLLSYSVKDAALTKGFILAFGLIAGGLLYGLGW